MPLCRSGREPASPTRRASRSSDVVAERPSTVGGLVELHALAVPPTRDRPRRSDRPPAPRLRRCRRCRVRRRSRRTPRAAWKTSARRRATARIMMCDRSAGLGAAVDVEARPRDVDVAAMRRPGAAIDAQPGLVFERNRGVDVIDDRDRPCPRHPVARRSDEDAAPRPIGPRAHECRRTRYRSDTPCRRRRTPPRRRPARGCRLSRPGARSTSVRHRRTRRPSC